MNSKVYQIGNRTFDFSQAYVMGILNVTPDSFSDGGKFFDKNFAIQHSLGMIKEGVDIIDIGGESTRPNSDFVDEETEINRVIPVIEKILSEHNDTIISVDTNKSIVAEEALRAGAKIVNDISGLQFDEKMVDVVKKYDAALIVMHIKGTPKNMQISPTYENLIGEIKDYLGNSIYKAEAAGIKNIIVDPGIGFGKTMENNYEIIKRLDEFEEFGYPILIGLSRKNFIGKTLNLEVTERDVPTAILEAASIKNGARIIRTHNVQYGKYVCNLLNNII